MNSVSSSSLPLRANSFTSWSNRHAFCLPVRQQQTHCLKTRCRNSVAVYAEESSKESHRTVTEQTSTPAEPSTSQPSTSFGAWAAGGAVGLGVAVFAATRLATGSVSLSDLERTSIPLDTALQNQRPTMVEFYANWCEVCRELTPEVYQVEQEFKDKVNFVMLNIENPKWAPEMSEYRVGGIPQFVFLDGQGQPQAAAVGRLPKQVLEGNVKALSQGTQLPFRGASGATSSLGSRSTSMAAPNLSAGPRSHS